MIAVIITIVVCITIGIISIIRMNKEQNKIRELEQRLDEYYKRRENNLLNKFGDIEQRDTKPKRIKSGHKSRVIKRGIEWPE